MVNLDCDEAMVSRKTPINLEYLIEGRKLCNVTDGETCWRRSTRPLVGCNVEEEEQTDMSCAELFDSDLGNKEKTINMAPLICV